MNEREDTLIFDLDDFWQGEYFYTKYDIGGRGHSITINATDKEAFVKEFLTEIEKIVRSTLVEPEEEG